MISTLLESTQLAAGSPSEAVTVTVTDPGAKHLNEGVALEASLNEPELADQWYASAAGPLSAS